MVENFYGYLKTPIGGLKITASLENILGIEFEENEPKNSSNHLIEAAMTQLSEYFEGKRQVFDLPLKIEGSEFQQKAWRGLAKIPYGETISYKKQASNLGNPNASRAVGGANNKNKFAIVIPCHRVVGKNGSLVGYAGGLDKKNWLIEHEKRMKNEKF